VLAHGRCPAAAQPLHTPRVAMLWIKDRNDLFDVVDHFGHWGTKEDLRDIFEQIRGREELRLLWQRLLGSGS
jgi:hypothetical protein